MDGFEREVCTLSINLPAELIQTSSSITFLQDNRLVICCSDVIIVALICVEQNGKFSRKCSPKADPLLINTTRVFYRSQLPAFTIAEGILNVASSLKNISADERHCYATDTLLSEHNFLPRVDSGGFRSVKPSSFYTDNGVVLGVVTYDHTLFILEEHKDKWKCLVSLNQLVKDLVLFNRDVPLELESDLSFEQFKDMVYSMSYCELTWSSVFQVSRKSADSNKENKEFVLLFTGMKNGDIHIWQVMLPLRTVDDFIHFKTEKGLSEVTALHYHPISKVEGYVCVGSMNGNVTLLHTELQDQGDANVSQVFADSHDDSLHIQAFTSLEVDGSHILVTAKQYFLLFYLIQPDKIELVKTMHMECSLPIGSLSMHGRTVFASSEDGIIFELAIDADHDQNVSVELKKKKSSNLYETMASDLSCKGVSLSSNGALVIYAYRPESDYIYSCQRSNSSSDIQNVVLNIPSTFSISSFIENAMNCQTFCTNFQDALISVCIYFHSKVTSEQWNEQDKMLSQRLFHSDKPELLQIVRAFICQLKVLDIEQRSILGVDDKLNEDEIDKQILAKHAIACLQLASEGSVDDSELEYLACMTAWMKQFRPEESTVTEKFTQFVRDSTMKCCVCQQDVKSFDSPLSVICVGGHRTKLSCLTLTPIQGLNIRTCFSCGAVAENLKSLLRVSFLRFKAKTCCARCGGFLKSLL